MIKTEESKADGVSYFLLIPGSFNRYTKEDLLERIKHLALPKDALIIKGHRVTPIKKHVVVEYDIE